MHQLKLYVGHQNVLNQGNPRNVYPKIPLIFGFELEQQEYETGIQSKLIFFH